MLLLFVPSAGSLGKRVEGCCGTVSPPSGDLQEQQSGQIAEHRRFLFLPFFEIKKQGERNDAKKERHVSFLVKILSKLLVSFNRLSGCIFKQLHPWAYHCLQLAAGFIAPSPLGRTQREQRAEGSQVETMALSKWPWVLRVPVGKNPIKLIISARPFVQSAVSQKEKKKQMAAILETA